MCDYFEKEPTSLWGKLSITNVIYAGYDWFAINTAFRNGKLASVHLRYTDLGIESELILDRYYILYNALKERYYGNTQYGEIPEERGETGLYYYDGRYAVYLILRFHIKNNKKDYYEVGLFYQDEKLLSQSQKQGINDLQKL